MTFQKTFMLMNYKAWRGGLKKIYRVWVKYPVRLFQLDRSAWTQINYSFTEITISTQFLNILIFIPLLKIPFLLYFLDYVNELWWECYLGLFLLLSLTQYFKSFSSFMFATYTWHLHQSWVWKLEEFLQIQISMKF